MSVNSSCPCCSSSMLLHLNSRRSYWFCNHCRLEMPNLKHELKGKKTVNLSSSLNKTAIAAGKLARPVAAV